MSALLFNLGITIGLIMQSIVAFGEFRETTTAQLIKWKCRSTDGPPVPHNLK